MWADVTVKSPSHNGQGIMPDSSYHFHGQQPLNYAYGADWLMDVLNFHAAAVGTAFDLPSTAIDLLARFMVDGNAHMSWGKYYGTLMGACTRRPLYSLLTRPSPLPIHHRLQPYGPWHRPPRLVFQRPVLHGIHSQCCQLNN